MKTTQAALQLKPFVLRWIQEASISFPSQVNYVIYLSGSTCIAANGATGVVDFSGTNHATVIQAAINAAGENASITWRPGTYNIGTQLAPLNRQSWHVPFGAVFVPTGNNRIIYAVGVEWWHVYGTLHIEDTAQNSAVEAVYFDALYGCYFQHLWVWDYYNGMVLRGTTGRSAENTFDNVYLAVMRNKGLQVLDECGDQYFNNVLIKGPSTVEWSTGAGLTVGLQPGVGSIFGGIMFGRVEVLDCLVNVDLQGLVEVWFGQLLLDNAYAQAMYIGDAVKRLFVDRVWVAGSGNGIWIQGSTTSTVQELSFNHIFAWVNAEYGVLFNGYIDGVRIGHLHCLENQVAQLKYARGSVRNIWIDKLTVEDSNLVAIDASGIDGTDANCGIGHADIDDGECMGLDLLGQIDGMRDGKPFENRGVAYIPIGTSYVVVPHGLEGRPLFVNLTAHHYDARQAFISALDTTNFVIDSSYAVGATARVAWVARSGVEIGAELLLNPNVDTGTPPSNWVAYNGAFLESSDVYNGIQALRINGGFHEWKSDPFSAAEYARYRISGYVKGTGNAFAELAIRFWHVTGGWSVVGYGVVSLKSVFDYASGFVRVGGDFTAPAGTEAADILFHNTAHSTTDVYADDFFFGLPGGSNLLANDSVEAGTGTPDYWTLTGATWESGTARTGSRSLRLVNAATDKQARTRWVNVSGSTAYEVSAYLQGLASGNVALVVQWYSDAGGIGNLIREDARYINAAPGSWALETAQFTAPASAASAYAVLRMVGWIGFDLIGDGFSAKQLV